VKVRLIFSILLLSAFCTVIVAAQDNQAPANNDAGVSTTGVNLIARTTQAVDYRRGATTGVDFKGTDLMPELTGKAKIISKKGLVDVHVDLENLKPAKNVDVAYLTYVLWAISPEGNAKNIGELIEKDGAAYEYPVAGVCVGYHCGARFRCEPAQRVGGGRKFDSTYNRGAA